MVFVMAIGISFASIGLEKEVQSGQFVGSPSCPELAEPECSETGEFDCQVESLSLEMTFDVYENATCSGNIHKNVTPEPIEIP